MSLSTVTLKRMLNELELSKFDLADMLDYTTRGVDKWLVGKVPVPIAVALFLIAMKQGKIDRNWAETTIHRYRLPKS